VYIERHIEHVVTRIAKRKPVIVLTGARQVGKSTMLKEVFHGIRYIALDRPLVRESAKDNPSLFFETYKPPVIVDEIQKAAELFDYIKDIVDDKKAKGQFFLTGSQSIKLMKNISESLAGRAGVIKLLGLSMRELTGVKHSEAFLPIQKRINIMEMSGINFNYANITTCIHKGFFPELYETESDLHDWADFYSSYFQTYIEKDIHDLLTFRMNRRLLNL